MLQLPQLATPSPQGSSGAVSPVAPSFGPPGGSTGVGTTVQTPVPTWTGEAGGLLRSTILQPATPLERAPANGPGVGPGPDTPGAVARAPELIGPTAPSQPTGSEWKFHAAPLGEDCAHMYAYDFDGDGDSDVLSSAAHKVGICGSALARLYM